MTSLRETLKKTIDFEEKTKRSSKSKSIIIDSKNKDIIPKIINKRSL